MISRRFRAAGSRSSAARTSRRNDSNIGRSDRSSRAEVRSSRMLKGQDDDLRRMFSVIRQPAQRIFHVLGGQREQRFKRLATRQFAPETRRGDRRTTPVSLKPNLTNPTVNDSKVKAREVATAVVFLLADCVGIPHHPYITGGAGG